MEFDRDELLYDRVELQSDRIFNEFGKKNSFLRRILLASLKITQLINRLIVINEPNLKPEKWIISPIYEKIRFI